ncbi:hypothetical protein XK97_08590 [Obesumbacterium proteus]|nr:hypothetical protein XK97_08590 [Obesumbacterium proteus]
MLKALRVVCLSIGRASHADRTSAWSLGRLGWAIPNRSENAISDKSARVKRPRAGGLLSDAYTKDFMVILLLIGGRNLSPIFQN